MAICSSIILGIVALLSTTMMISMVEAHDKDDRPVVAKWCSPVPRPEGDKQLRQAGMDALQYAISQYNYIGQGTPPVYCVTSSTDTVYHYASSVKCTSYNDGHLSATDCYNCLSDAKVRLIDDVCKSSIGGQIELEDCAMAYYDYHYTCPKPEQNFP
ncbi:hypothetical protein LINGRAHAP2_LOCUS13575 [Linum grandiflorum]